MAENILKIEISLSNIKEKEGREVVLTEIKKKVCALLNTNGGKIVLTAIDATTNNKIDADKVIRPVEQYFKGIIGSYKIHKRFTISEEGYNAITLCVQSLPKLCTLNTCLFVPTITEILQLISGADEKALRYILFERRIDKVLEHEIPEQFLFGRNCGFRESQTVQFKLLKTEKTEQTDLADRVIDKKFTDIISSFANADGGNIFYGIKDDGIVKGEKLSDSELCETTEKLEKAVEEMIWQDKSRKVERGKEWDIKFVPVKDCNNETIPSTFVMVVTVNPYIGGVFTKEPESYYLEDSEVKRMSFDCWRRNMYHKAATPVQEIKRSSWSSDDNRRSYMKITQTLENLRQLGNWKQIERIVNEINRRDNLPVNTKLTCLVQIVALHYRQGNFEEAKNILKRIENDKDSAEDKSVFAVKERYSASAIERSRGNYQEAWKIIEEGLELAHHAPAGLIPASVYANAASILSFLVDDESFIDTSKGNKDSTSKIHEFVEKAKTFCHRALQHLLYIEDEFEIAREDLRQRIKITLASLHLKLADPNHPSSLTADEEIAKAMHFVKGTEKSLKKGTTRLMYNSCRLSLVKSDIYFKKYELEATDKRIEHFNKSRKIVHEAQEEADKNSFQEMKRLCGKRLQRSETNLKNVQKDEVEQPTDEVVDELLYN